jgi:tyrosyl-tRNA synthetase
MVKEKKKELSVNEKYELITRNLQEVIGGDELKKLLADGKEISVYWGTMPTGSPHVSYFVPFLKISDFLRAGLRVKILIADLHAALDGVPWTILDKRQAYYEEVIPSMLSAIGVDLKKLEFVRGSSFQTKSKYFEDTLKMSMKNSVNDCIKAASEVVKLGENPKLGGLIYPIMQALDEEYLGVDIQFGGMDQRKIFVFARENLPGLGYKARVELLNPIIPGLIGKKMSSSIPGTKVDVMDDMATVNSRINKAECIEGNSDNGLMAFMRYVIFVIKQDRGEKFKIERPAKFGGNKEYSNYVELEKDFNDKKLHPMDLKTALAKEINDLLVPIRANNKLKKLYSEAYTSG